MRNVFFFLTQLFFLFYKNVGPSNDGTIQLSTAKVEENVKERSFLRRIDPSRLSLQGKGKDPRQLSASHDPDSTTSTATSPKGAARASSPPATTVTSPRLNENSSAVRSQSGYTNRNTTNHNGTTNNK